MVINENTSKVLDLQAELCKALGDSKRLHIIIELRVGELTVNELTVKLGISQSNTSQHISVLRKVGIITPRKKGSTTYYRLSDDKIIKACDLVNETVIEQLASQRLLSGV